MAAWTFQELATLRLWRSFSLKKKAAGGVLDTKDTLLDRAKTDRVPYDAWERGGHIHTTPGKAVKYGFVAERIADLSMLFDIKAIAFDQYRINILSRN
jgi:phage terminase large subunit-like protein